MREYEKTKRKGKAVQPTYTTETHAPPAIKDVVRLTDGQAVISSLDVARVFEKQHNDVLRAVRNEIECCAIEDRRNFAQIFIADSYGRSQPCYHLTSTAFLAVCMGFTGVKASQLRWAVIRRMNELEQQVSRDPIVVVEPATPFDNIAFIEQQIADSQKIEKYGRDRRRGFELILKTDASQADVLALLAKGAEQAQFLLSNQRTAAIYVLRCLSGAYKGIYKIGMVETPTDDAVQARCKAIAMEYGGDWRVCKSIYTDNKRLEQSFHTALRQYKQTNRHKRELFNLPDDVYARIEALGDYIRFEDFTSEWVSSACQQSLFEAD